jgi:hypothetical protein
MEYVEGRPIDKFCDERGLSLRKRLELFREVCAAVQYAHTNLVVHRDSMNCGTSPSWRRSTKSPEPFLQITHTLRRARNTFSATPTSGIFTTTAGPRATMKLPNDVTRLLRNRETIHTD